MAFCTHCGAQLPDGARFCTSCGTPVAAAPTVNPAPQPQAPVQQAPQPQAPVQQAPQPQAPQYNQPVQPRPTPQPAAEPPRGIVIDAPADATVTISDGVPPTEASTSAPAEKGEFVVASWSAPKKQTPQPQAPAAPQQPSYQQPAHQQPPQYQQPYQQPQYPQQPQYQQPYQQPQYPQYPQQPYQQAPKYPRQQPYQQAPQQPAANGPMTFKQALNKSKNDVLGRFQKKPAQPNAAPATKPKRKWYFWVIVVALVIWIIYYLLKIFG